MAASWDIFGDEKKAPDGGVSHLGLLLVEAGVVCPLAHFLLDEKNRLQSKGVEVGSIHWSQIGKVEGKLACRWLGHFFRMPLMFFVLIPVAKGSSRARLEMVERAITILERDRCVPAGGLERGLTTLHLDYDNQDARELHERLVRGFGLLRAFHWSDRDSVLLQLADLLLGISERARSGRVFGDTAGEIVRRKVFEHARERAQHYSEQKKDNWIFSYEPAGALRRLLV